MQKDSKFEVIVMDPPWPSEELTEAAQAEVILHLGEGLDVEKLASGNSSLWLWAGKAFFEAALYLAEEWGFEPRKTIVWMKLLPGITKEQMERDAECCVVAFRGKPEIRPPLSLMLARKNMLLLAPPGRDGGKPERFYQLIELCCPGRKLDYFGRKREGWETYETF